MELKLTTKRAIEYEQRTGEDILQKLEAIAKEGKMSVKDAVEIFKSMGENYTVEMFDAWDASFADKLVAMFQEIGNFARGKN